MSTALPGRIGPYTLQDLLATGAHAQVWSAQGPQGPVAVKVARTPEAQEALQREASVLAQIRHPHLTELIEAQPEGEWLALRLQPGTTMDVWAQDRDVRSIVHAAAQVVDALTYLHARQIVHGDVKPTNVVVDDEGHACLIDLGVATRAGTSVEGFRGTLGYAAPELLSGQPPTERTDLYGLGAALYTCLTGRTPFVAPDPAALTYLPLVSLPPPPSAFVPELPSALTQLILSLLARSPGRRPGDPDQLRQALLASAEGPPRLPVLGMLEARDALRRAVVGAADREARVVVVYGAPGSGRRTLISEAVEYARREGLAYVRETGYEAALTKIRASPAPVVMVMRASHPGAQRLAEHALREQLQCLLLLHAERPTPRLVQAGAIQVTPAPLARHEAERLAELMGASAAQAEEWWRDSMGLPIAMVGRVRAWRRRQGLTAERSPDLPSEARRIYDALRQAPRMEREVSALARELGVGEHALLDHTEVLFAEGLVESTENGLMLAVVRTQGIQ